MKIQTITSTRLVLTPDEKKIRDTWGRDWERMRKDERDFGSFALLTGAWSGYNGGSRSVPCHVQYMPFAQTKTIRLHTVRFTDGTTLDIIVEMMTIEKLLAQGTTKKLTYEDLIHTARTTLQEEYRV